ncbi:hypothetical protein FOCG_17958 [Fusarium oxysporum f. sp. radicis-lycopersici 26381]|nr:hypothetical protein FOWG_16960 [Fusarium oxysporum f. sp. lycopersici MN25]EXL39438.1 hypothetical protein FOCG_17958 [Fusarium oxysporum f. sp. radicis-lycopersici 26381]
MDPRSLLLIGQRYFVPLGSRAFEPAALGNSLKVVCDADHCATALFITEWLAVGSRVRRQGEPAYATTPASFCDHEQPLRGLFCLPPLEEATHVGSTYIARH